MSINPGQLISPSDYKNKWVEGLSDEQYHSDKTTVSSSTLKKVELVSLKTFRHAFFVAGPSEPTEPMKLGKLAHMAILEGAKFKERYIVMPEFTGFTQKGDLTSSANCKEVRDKKSAWLSDLPEGAIVATVDERDKILGMIESLLSHAKASEFLRVGIAECSGYYRDPITGITCRIRPDFMCRDRGIITELKTTKDCREASFRWDIFGDRYPMWYDFQLAMQIEGFKQIEGKAVGLAAWVAIETEAPYEVAVHPMTIPVQEIGHIKYRRALTKLKSAIDNNEWPGVQASGEYSFIVPPESLLNEYGVNHDTELV